MSDLGIILGVISLGLTSFFIVLFAILFVVLFTWVRRQVKAMRRYCSKEKRRRTSEGGGEDGGERSIELTNQVTTEQVTPLAATNHAFTSSNTYEDTPTNHTLPTSGPIDSGMYTDVLINGPLPGFLRNEEMLVAPSVSPEVVAAARESNLRNEEIEVEPIIVVKKRASLGNDDYVDPQDAKTEAAAIKKHDKIIKKVSKGHRGVSKRSSDTSLPRALSDRDDYTTVVNALPQGDFERVDMSRGGGGRGRTSSDVSPMMSAKWSGHTGDSGRVSSNSDSPSGGGNFQKSSSVRDYKRPKHVTTATKSPSKTQPIRRRSTLQQKELVSFDPQKGFKLIAKRTNSDGVASNSGDLNNGGESPVSDPGRSFIEDVVGGVHMYAAVDLKAKCRPEDDIMRREGVGVPEHYIAPVPCS